MTERQPQIGSSEGQESRENLPTEVSIYAVNWTQTHEDRISPQGFGSTRELNPPVQHTEYAWEGDFRALKNEANPKDPSYKDGLYTLYDQQESMKKSADNLSWQYLLRGNPKLDNQSKPSFTFKFSLSEQILKEKESGKRDYGEGRTLRPLAPSEQDKFLELFREANKKNLEEQQKQVLSKARYSPGAPPPPPSIKRTEAKESREQASSQITVFVQEQQLRKNNQKPETHKTYAWQGKLWRRDKDEYKLDTVSSNNRQTLKDLASNLAQNVLSNRNPKLRSSYRMGFEIPPELLSSIKKGDASNVTNIVKHLSPAEEQEFHRAFKEALGQLQK